MRFTLVNLTREAIFYLDGTGCFPTASNLVLPSETTTLDIPKLCSKLTLIPSSSDGGSNALNEKLAVNPNSLIIPVTMAFNVSWKVIPVPAGCPWRIYCSKASVN